MRALCIRALVLGLLLAGCERGPELLHEFPLDDLVDVPKLGEQVIHLSDESFDSGKSLYVENIGHSRMLLRELRGPELAVDDSILVYRARVRTRRVLGSVYAEMQVSLPGRGLYSNQITREDVIRGENEWALLEARFVLAEGEVPDGVNLNLVILGRGKVWADALELHRIPREGQPSSAIPEALNED